MSKIVRTKGGPDYKNPGDDGLRFCDDATAGVCTEFAQTKDPACEDLLKFKCPAHEAAARARGETGERPVVDYSNSHDWVGSARSPESMAAAATRNAEIALSLAQGIIPTDTSSHGKRAFASVPYVKPEAEKTDAVTRGHGDAVKAVVSGPLPVVSCEKAKLETPDAKPKEPLMAIQARKVQCIETGAIFDSPRDAAKSVGTTSIGWALAPSAKSNRAGGKSWRYVDGPATPAAQSMTPGAIRQRKRRALTPRESRGAISLAAPAPAARPSAALVIDAAADIPSTILDALASGLRGYAIENLDLSFTTAGRAVSFKIETVEGE